MERGIPQQKPSELNLLLCHALLHLVEELSVFARLWRRNDEETRRRSLRVRRCAWRSRYTEETTSEHIYEVIQLCKACVCEREDGENGIYNKFMLRALHSAFH